MKWIKYKYVCNVVDGEEILLNKKLTYSEENLAIAETEAVNGQYTIEDDGLPAPELLTPEKLKEGITSGTIPAAKADKAGMLETHKIKAYPYNTNNCFLRLGLDESYENTIHTVTFAVSVTENELYSALGATGQLAFGIFEANVIVTDYSDDKYVLKLRQIAGDYRLGQKLWMSDLDNPDEDKLFETTYNVGIFVDNDSISDLAEEIESFVFNITILNNSGGWVPCDINTYPFDYAECKYLYLGDPSITEAQAQKNLKPFAKTGNAPTATKAMTADKAGVLENIRVTGYLVYGSGAGWDKFASVPHDCASATISVHSSTSKYVGAFALFQLSVDVNSGGEEIHVKQIAGVNLANSICALRDGNFTNFYIAGSYYDEIGGDCPVISVISKQSYTGDWEFGELGWVEDLTGTTVGSYIYLGDPSITEAQAKNLKTFAVGETYQGDSLEWIRSDEGDYYVANVNLYLPCGAYAVSMVGHDGVDVSHSGFLVIETDLSCATVYDCTLGRGIQCQYNSESRDITFIVYPSLYPMIDFDDTWHEYDGGLYKIRRIY